MVAQVTSSSKQLRLFRFAAAAQAMVWAVAAPVLAEPTPKPVHIPITTPVYETPYGPEGAEERGLWMDVEEVERKLKTSPQIIKDPELNAYVRGVLCRTVGEKPCSAVRLYIVRTPEFNASMAPNGLLQVNTGMLLRLTSEAQLATILGHEFAHYEHRHATLMFREVKKKGSTAVWLAMTGIGLLAADGIERGLYSYSRDMEREADLDGLKKVAAAGYSQSEASAPWKLLRAEMDGTGAERKRKSKTLKEDSAYVTHPASAERIAYVEAEAAKQAPGSETGADRYKTAMAVWSPQFIEDQIKRNDFGASNALINYLGEKGWTPWLLFARGEIFRLRAADGDLEKAAGFYADGIKAGGTIPALWRGRGLALLKLGRTEEAKADLKEYLSRAPEASDRAMIAMLAGGNP